MFIDFSESNRALSRLERIDLNDPNSDEEITFLLQNKVNIPFVHVKIPRGLPIFRARKNENGKEFTTKDEISYNKFSNIIELGRANKKGQSIFYASHNDDTSLFETSSIVKYGLDIEKEIITCGRWIVNESFLLVTLLPKVNELANHGSMLHKYSKLIRKSPYFMDRSGKKHLDFFSNQFSRQTNGNVNLYKISSAYYNHCLEFSPRKIYGMLFPSVESEYTDLNLALTPEAVDKFLTLDKVIKYEITVKGEKGTILPIRIGDVNGSDIKWQ